MTQAEMLIDRLVAVGYAFEEAVDLVEMYDQCNKLSQLEDYILTKEFLGSVCKWQ